MYWYDRPSGSPTGKGGAGSAASTTKGGKGATASVIDEIPDLGFYDKLPTVWDDTKVNVIKLSTAVVTLSVVEDFLRLINRK